MKNYMSRVVLLFAGIVCGFILLTSDVSKVSGQTRKLVIKVNISPQANNNNPVALDLVPVQNGKLFKELMKIPASEWFEKRKQYRLAPLKIRATPLVRTLPFLVTIRS